jgi:integrase
MQSPDAPVTIQPDAGTDLMVAELAAQYLRWAETYYVKDGKPTTELVNVKRAIRTLRETYASLPAKDFSPLKLKHVRQRLIDEGLARLNCNRYVGIITRIFAWGVENELIPAGVAHGLREVKALVRGRSEARETDPILPVDDETVEATCKVLRPMWAAMVRIQLLLACRPGELVSMRPCDIDMTGPVWIYRPASHKTAHHGKERVIPIGPKAQLLLKPWLPTFPAQYVWRGRDGAPATASIYSQTVRRACNRAGLPHWTPNMLRHAGATKIRRQASLDAAQVILGHSTVQTTQIYAERNLDAALRIAAEVG